MPPQEEKEVKESSAATEEETPSTEDPESTEEAPSGEGGGSYWDAPPERELKGKTLSTMDMSSMIHQHEADAEEQMAEEKVQSSAKEGGYWDWRQSFRKSLSRLSISDLVSQHTNGEGAKEPRNWLQRNSSGSALKDQDTETQGSTSDAATENTDSPRASRRGSYWTWRNPSLKNLSNASLTSLEKQAKESDEKQGQEGASAAAPARPNYWFWRNASMKNIASDTSLEAMEKTAKESDRMEGKEGAVVGGPVSNMQHRIRNSWRKSFQRLSSNSLTRLNEHDLNINDSEEVDKKGLEDLAVPHEHDEESEGSEGALAF